MATVYSLSTYSLATIAVTVPSASSSPTYIWSVPVPSGAKGKSAILQIFFNLYSSTGFFAGQSFNYGIYVDGTALTIGDITSVPYVQTAAGTYALSSNGVTRGTTGILGYNPLLLPVSFSAASSLIQIGITNSALPLSSVSSVTPHILSNVTTATGTLNTSNYVPQNTFTTTGSFNYTVPTTVQGGAVQGVYIYLWGAGGSNVSQVGGQGTSANTFVPGGGGGFVSGFYSCAAGTVLTGVVGAVGNTNLAYGGGGNGAGGAPSGGFSGVFLSNAGGIVQSNAIAIAGGGGMGNWAAITNVYTGGGGGYPNGGAAYVLNHIAATTYDFDTGSNMYSSYCVGGTQNGYYSIPNANGSVTSIAAGTATSNYPSGYWPNSWGMVYGSKLLGASSYGTSGGGGWHGGCTGTTYTQFGPTGGGGGSSYIGNVNGATGGIGLTSGAAYANGTTATSAVTPSTVPPGGTSSSFYTGTYGYGNGSTGLVVIVPAVTASLNQVGVSATLFTL